MIREVLSLAASVAMLAAFAGFVVLFVVLSLLGRIIHGRRE